MYIASISVFMSMLLLDELKLGRIIRKALGYRLSKPLKLIDCFSCFTFWLSFLIVCPVFYLFKLQPTKEIVLGLITSYIIAKFYERYKRQDAPNIR